MSSNDQPEKKDVPRRPYTPPRLRRLGSVRELTLGATKITKKENLISYKP